MPTVANSMLTGHLEHDEEVHGAQSQQVAVVFAHYGGAVGQTVVHIQPPKVLALVNAGQLTLVGADTHTHTLKRGEGQPKNSQGGRKYPAL